MIAYMEAIFLAIAALEVASVIAVYTLRDILHAAIALASVFFANSLLFLLMGQDLLAILQLFIMIGGVSTYIFVGVASPSFSHFKHTSYIRLAVVAALLSAALLYPLLSAGFSVGAPNQLSQGSISASLSSSVEYLYFITIFVFAVSIGAVIALRKLGEKE